MLHFELFKQTGDLLYLQKAAASEASSLMQILAISDPPYSAIAQLKTMVDTKEAITDEKSYRVFRKNAERLEATLRKALEERKAGTDEEAQSIVVDRHRSVGVGFRCDSIW